MGKVSGVISEDSRILVIDQTTWQVLANQQKTAGAWEIDGFTTGSNKLVVAIGPTGEAKSYGTITQTVSTVTTPYTIPSSGWTVNSLTSDDYGSTWKIRASSAQAVGENLNVLNLVNAQIGNRWIASANTGWAAIKYPAEVIIQNYRVHNYDDVSSRAARNWTLQGSNNSTNGSDGTWTNLDSRTNIANNTNVTYTLSVSTPYLWFRINITQNWGFTTGGVSLTDWVTTAEASITI